MNESGRIPRMRGMAGSRAGHAAPESPSEEQTIPARPRCFHDFSATTIAGRPRDLSEYRGQLVLAVNTATHCAFTPQLESLQRLHEAYQQHGFTVLGFPSDQFHQDPGTDQDTEQICTSAYDTTFPLFSKVDVNGPSAHPLWTWLSGQKGGALGGRISWKFTKFLIDGQGRVLRRYAPPVPPTRIAKRIEQELGLQTGGRGLPR